MKYDKGIALYEEHGFADSGLRIKENIRREKLSV